MLCRLRVLVVAHFLCRGREFNSQNLSGTLDDSMHLNLCTGRRTRQSVSALLNDRNDDVGQSQSRQIISKLCVLAFC